MRGQVILVDEQDQALGTAEKIAAHEQAQLHRAFSVFVFRQHEGKTELLLQQRNPEKYHCGGLWTNTCCSHPQPGEATIAAGQARLQEELGFTCPLEHHGFFIYHAAFDNGLTEHELDHVLVGHFDAPLDRFDPTEISAVRWVALEALAQEMQDHPERFTPWFSQALRLATK